MRTLNRLRFDHRTGGYSAFYSRVSLTKGDTPGVGDVFLRYNRGYTYLARNFLMPEVRGKPAVGKANCGALAVRGSLSAPGWTGQERLTWGGPDLIVYSLTADCPAPLAVTGSFPEKFETDTSRRPMPVQGDPRGSWSYDRRRRTLAFNVDLPRTDRRDPAPTYAARIVLGLPASLSSIRLEWLGRETVLPLDRSARDEFKGRFSFRLEAGASGGVHVFAAGFDMANRETKRELLDRVAAARDAGYDAALSACGDWLSEALGTFVPAGRTDKEQDASVLAVWALISNTSRPQGRFGSWNPTFPNHGQYSSHYLWDTCFQSLGHATFNPEIARNSLRILAANQERDGKIPQFVCSTWNRPGESQPPLLAWAAWNLHRRYPDAELLAELYPALSRNLRWWRRERDVDGDGLMEYIAALESGWDDSPRWDHGGRTTACDLNAFLVAHQRCLARMARVLGKDGEADDWNRAADVHARRLVERLWQPDLGRFCDLRAADGGRIEALTPASLIPLWIGPPLAAPDAHRAIENLLLNPSHFFGKYPFPVVAYSDPAYNPAAWWRGPIWPNVAYLMLEILDMYGYAAERDEAADRLIDMAVRAGRPYELFNSATGAGMGVLDYGWTASLLLRLLDGRRRGTFEASER